MPSVTRGIRPYAPCQGAAVRARRRPASNAVYVPLRSSGQRVSHQPSSDQAPGTRVTIAMIKWDLLCGLDAARRRGSSRDSPEEMMARRGSASGGRRDNHVDRCNYKLQRHGPLC